MGKIKIDTAVLRSKIELMKNEKIKIDDVLENFKGESLKIETYWTGKAGDAVKEEVDSYVTEFDYISSNFQKFIVFLENVAKAYENEDNMISNKIDSNGSIMMK